MSRLDSACDAIDLVAATVDTLAGIVENDVFGVEFVDRCASPERRRTAIDELYTEDVVFYDPSKGVYRGRDEIDRIAGAIKATHPDRKSVVEGKRGELGRGRISEREKIS